MARLGLVALVSLGVFAPLASARASAVERSADRQDQTFRPVVAEIKSALLDLRSLARTGTLRSIPQAATPIVRWLSELVPAQPIAGTWSRAPARLVPMSPPISP